MTGSPTQHHAAPAAPAGWSALELAALHTAGVAPRRLRELRTTYATADAYQEARDGGAHLDLPALVGPGNLAGCLPPNVWVLAAGDELYPPQLAAAPGAPVLLYGQGDPAALRPGIAVAGTRAMTDLGRIVAGLAATAAATAGAPVVSGLARGVAGAAAAAALAAPTPTVAVIAAGVCHPTPTEHTELAGQIIATGGAVISEQPPGYDPATAPRGDRRYAALLQARNRIIAGLATAVVVAEAGARSGTTGTGRAGRRPAGPRGRTTPRPPQPSWGAAAAAARRPAGAHR